MEEEDERHQAYPDRTRLQNEVPYRSVDVVVRRDES
jgi:hypothetical protein